LPWFNDLASELGIPAGAATLALGMYAACVAAEKTARPEALGDIGRILKDSSWSRLVRPSEIIGRVFIWTFAARHLSLRCITKSALATTLFLFGSVGTIYIHHPREIHAYFNILGFPPSSGLVERIIVTGFVADYVALLKSRILLRSLGQVGGSFLRIVVLDVVGSVAISFIINIVLDVLYFAQYQGNFYFISVLRRFYVNLRFFHS
jgi:hypothetical protein